MKRKQKWRLEGRLLYKTVRKFHRESGKERRETIRWWFALMGGNTEEEGNCIVLEIHLKEWAVLKVYCVSQPWRMTPGKWVPIDGLKQVRLTEGLWETKLCSWRVCTWLLIPPPQKGRKIKLKLPRTLDSFLQTCQCLFQL